MRRAAPPELALVQDLLAEASNWQLARGLANPWPVPYPEDRLRPSLERGEVFFAEEAPGEVVGTVTLQWEDEPYWGRRPPDAGYVHKLAVRRVRAGRGVGVAILRWAEGEVRARGRAFLRLDTLTERTRLHAYYVGLGFVIVGEIRRGGLDITLFEKPLRGVERGPRADPPDAEAGRPSF